MTFGSDPNTQAISVELSFQKDDEVRIRIDDKEPFSNRDSLKSIVTRLRTKFPFLNNWRLNSAQRGWGRSIIYFRNMGNTEIDEFSEEYLLFSNDSYEERPVPNDNNKSFPIAAGLHPLAGGFSSVTHAVSPINGLHLSEFSSHYLALFLLSSLVRYRPEIWTHAISRSTTQEIPADDGALSLIEQFLVLNTTIFPDIVATILNPHEDAWFK